MFMTGASAPLPHDRRHGEIRPIDFPTDDDRRRIVIALGADWTGGAPRSLDSRLASAGNQLPIVARTGTGIVQTTPKQKHGCQIATHWLGTGVHFIRSSSSQREPQGT
jgi:hypothetical protein